MFSRWWLLIFVPALLLWTFAFVVKWIVAPIRIKRKQRMKVHPKWEPTELEQLTPEMRDFMGRTIGRFREIEFEVVLNTRTPDMVSGVVGYRLLFVNRATNDVAKAILAKTATMRNMVVFIQSIFSDGSRVTTGSNPQISSQPRDPAKNAANFAWVNDPGLLWTAHLRRLERMGKASAPRIAPAPGEEEQFATRERESEVRRMVECGYRWLDAAAGEYRLTWKGAFLSAWKLTQPIKRWRIAARDRAARRLWASLGMGPIESPVVESGAPGALPPIPASLPNVPATAPVVGATLSYAAPVAPGQVHRIQSGGELTMRIGSPSVGKVLARSWWAIAFAAFSLAMLGWTLYRFWLFYQIMRVLPPRFYARELRMVLRSSLIWVGLLAFEGWQLGRALSRARGAAVLAADHSGLRYSNIAGRPRAGFIPRDEFQSFAVVLDRLGLGGRTYRLVVRTRSAARPILISAGGAAATYKSAALDLSEAMGVDAPRSVPLPLPLPA